MSLLLELYCAGCAAVVALGALPVVWVLARGHAAAGLPVEVPHG
jgi:hypothetical protein